MFLDAPPFFFCGNIPFIPFVHNAQDVVYFFFILARVTGMFFVAPFLSSRNVPRLFRVGIVIFLAALVAMVLYPDYRGDHPKYHLAELNGNSSFSLFVLATVFVKELAIGYLFGFVYSLVFEGLLVAGQTMGVLMGFSIMELIDPMSDTSRPLISQFFVVFCFLLMISMDLHFPLIQQFVGSFTLLPLGNYELPYESLDYIAQGTGRVFVWSLQYIAVPYVILFLATIGLGFMARIMPEMNVFMLGFPLKIILGYYCLIFSLAFFPEILARTFVECGNLVDVLLKLLRPSA